MARKQNKPVTWGQFADAMLDGKRQEAESLFARMTDAQMIENARRWLYGPTAKQRQESRERQRAINATTQAEINRHCQFDGLPRM